MKTVDITYRYEAQDKPARPRPLDNNAALRRLNDSNHAFATLLKSLSHESGGVQRIISVDSRDLSLLRGGASDPTRLQAVYGVFLLETCQVSPRVSELNGIGLAAAPRDAAGFIELGDAIMRSDRIASLVQTKK
jgi:hypothetical protein